MKNNQKKHNHQTTQHGQHVPFSVADLLKDTRLIGADINISDGHEITIPRTEYNDMIRRLAYLDMVRDFLRKEKPGESNYMDVGVLRKILGIMDPITINAKEDF